MKCFGGVYALNEINLLVKHVPFAIIVNTQPRWEPGEHWVAIFISDKGKGVYFDPYGLPPLQNEFYNFLNRNCRVWKYNTVTIQGPQSLKCGEYCTIYVACRCSGREHKNELSLFSSIHLSQNDATVDLYMKKLKEGKRFIR